MTEEQYYNIAKSFLLPEFWILNHESDLCIELGLLNNRQLHSKCVHPWIESDTVPYDFNFKHCLLDYFSRYADRAIMSEHAPPKSQVTIGKGNYTFNNFEMTILQVELRFDTKRSMNRCKLAQPEIFNVAHN